MFKVKIKEEESVKIRKMWSEEQRDLVGDRVGSREREASGKTREGEVSGRSPREAKGRDWPS